MKIVILRHGKPKIENSSLLSALDFGYWVSSYDNAPIDEGHLPPQKIVDLAASCSFVVCSSLQRSAESASLLGVSDVALYDPMFKECEMPHAHWRWPKLPLGVWSLSFRLFQFFGYSPNAETFKQAKRRASVCAQQLQDWATKHESVLFVGHGFLNRLVARELRQLGWVGPASPGSDYWQHGTYRRAQT